MTRWFRNSSIRRKLTVLLCLMGAATLSLSTFAFVANDIGMIRSSMVRTLTALAEVMGANTAATLVFDDASAARETLASLRQEPLVVAACVYDASGKVFATYARDSKPPFAPPPRNLSGENLQGRYMDVFKPIREGKQNLGTVLLRGDMGTVRKQINHYLLIVMAVLGTCFVVSILLSILLRRVISGPVLRMAQATESVSRTHDFSVRVRKEGNDELGSLCDGFNNMLAEIQKRDGQLDEYRANLEQLVKDRTADLEKKTEELQSNYQQLQKLEKLRDDLTNMIVHDLRTPLTSVISGLRTLETMGEYGEQQRQVLDMARDGGEVLLGMTNDLLDLSKMEEGSLQLEYERLTAEKVASGALQQVSSLAEHKGVSLVSTVGNSLPAFNADYDKLRRTLVNLLDNAIKFTPSGGTVTLSAESRESEKSILFAVRDTGEGIPEEYYDRIFEKFGQVETRKSGRKMSTGLGLTFCKMVAEAHGGATWVESELGKGSTFWVKVPLQPGG